MTRADADRLGAWWGELRGHLQPAEFLIDEKGEIVHSLYASGPIGRMSPEDLIYNMQFFIVAGHETTALAISWACRVSISPRWRW